MRKLASMALTVVLMMAILVACGGKKEEAGNANGKKELVMGTSADYPPYEDVDVSTEKIVGFDVDIAKYIGEKLGFTVQIENMDFDGLLAALSTDKVDFVMAGMTPNADREKNADFTDIYFDAKNTIVAMKGSNLTKLEDLKGKKVGAQLGSIQEEAANEIDGAEVQLLGKIPEIIQELKSGRIHAAIIEDTVAKGYVAANDDLEFNVVPSEGASGSAIALPKGSKYVDQFNDVLKEMKDNGELDKLVKKWFEK